METYTPRASRPAVSPEPRKTSPPLSSQSHDTGGDNSSHRRNRRNESPKIPLKWILLAVGVGVILVAGALVCMFSTESFGSKVDKDKYQAVFLSGGQVYFGRLETVGKNHLRLTDVFYLQANSSDSSKDSENPQSSSTDSNMQLIKLGNEVHGPEDEMIVNREQVIFFENLKKGWQG